MSDFFISGNANKAAFGQYGMNVRTTGTTTAGVLYYAITALAEAAVTATVVPETGSGGDTSISVTIPAGATITGVFHTIGTDAAIVCYLKAK